VGRESGSLKRYALLASASASFLSPFMGSAVNLAIPSIGREFQTGATVLSWVVSSFILATAVLLLPFGRMADIVGRRKVFILGMAVFSVSSFICAAAWSIEALIAFRFVQGIGGAMIFGTSIAILTTVYPPEERGRVLGINVASTYTGLSVGPVLGGVLNHQFGWASIFYLTGALAAATFVFAAARLKGEWAEAKGERFDRRGAALYMVGLTAFLYGLSSIATSSWAKYILVLGVVVLATFVRQEWREEQPILNMKLFSRNIAFFFSNLAALINYCATFAVGFLLSIHLQVVMGFNSQTAGLIMLSQPVLMAVLSPYAGRLSDRAEPRLVASAGMFLSALGLSMLVFLSEGTPVWQIVVALVFLGVGFAFFASPNTSAIMGSVEKKFYGVASSTLGTMRLIGQAISIASASLIVNLYIGDARLGPAVAHLVERSIEVSFSVFAVTCFLGVFASYARGNVNAARDEAAPGNNH